MITGKERIGNRISELRVEKGYSIRKLAELSGVPFQNIWKLEHGKYNASLDLLSKITQALEVNIFIK